jgi:putative ABC transport system permease protein
LLRGRAFRPGEQDAVIVSESAARAVWGREDPLGKLWDLSEKGGPAAADPQGPYTVVGVVKDSGANLIFGRDSVEAYLALGAPTRFPGPGMLIVHTTGDPSAIVHSARAIAIRPGFTASAYRMREPLDRMTTAFRNIAMIVGMLGGTVTLLAAIGIFGLLAYTVAQRTREIGVRVALGAQSPDILRLLASQYTVPLVAGAVAGVALAAACGRIMERAGLTSSVLDLRLDPTIYMTGPAILALVVLVAALARVLRALRISPATALRWE